jgi:hypothetical protein
MMFNEDDFIIQLEKRIMVEASFPNAINDVYHLCIKPKLRNTKNDTNEQLQLVNNNDIVILLGGGVTVRYSSTLTRTFFLIIDINVSHSKFFH